MKDEKTCKTSKKPYTWRKKSKRDWNNVVYCSEKCKWDAGVMRIPIPKERKCKCCKKSFSPLVFNQLYCGEICYQKSVDDRR